MKIILLILVIITMSCGNEHRYEIKQALGQELPKEATEVYYKQVFASPDYTKPYNIFIKFTIDSASFFDFAERMRLISSREDYLALMCMEKVGEGLKFRIWNFDSAALFNSSLAKDINWWNPITKDLLLYASFYSGDTIDKVIHCYRNRWDGRILAGYDRKKQIAYILIEVLMGDNVSK